jgi:hypothetical protein
MAVVVATTGDDDGGGVVKVSEANERVGGPAGEERVVDAVAEPGKDGCEKEKEQILNERGHVGQRHGVVRSGEW